MPFSGLFYVVFLERREITTVKKKPLKDHTQAVINKRRDVEPEQEHSNNFVSGAAGLKGKYSEGEWFRPPLTSHTPPFDSFLSVISTWIVVCFILFKISI